VATGPMQFGANNNAGPNPPIGSVPSGTQTILRAQNPNQETLVVRNEAAGGLTAGDGLTAVGGPVAVRGLGGRDTDLPGWGVVGEADNTGVHDIAGAPGVIGQAGVIGQSVTGGHGVWGHSPQANGVQGVSNSFNASGVYGANTAGGYGVTGRTFGNVSGDRAAVLGESVPDPSRAPGCANGAATGVYGYSETGYGGVFISGLAGPPPPPGTGVFGCPNPNGGLRVVGNIVKTKGEYSEALPHPDGSQRLLYAPMSPESWFEDYGRAQLVGGRVEVELDTDFVAVLGIEDGEYHVFLTPEGDTQGLYVESRSARSFIVREQQAGTSNTTFSYRVAVKNKHRHPERLEILEEPEELTKPPQPSPPQPSPPQPGAPPDPPPYTSDPADPPA
jgi:hypothetical protein